MEKAASDKVIEKNIQGKIPERTNKPKFFISVLKTTLKTKLIATIIKIGFKIAQEIPRIDPEYFVLSCLTTIVHNIWRDRYIFFILCLNILKQELRRSPAV